jgi:glycosyltransferase involved in cell wall biosynthesis
MIREDPQQRSRFCLIGPAYPYRGGISHYNTTLIRKLAERHEVWAVNFGRLYPDFLFPGKTQYDESASPYEAPSERIIDSINPFTWIRAGFHAARRRPDVVVVQWWHPFFAPAIFVICAILRLLRSGMILFICHNVVPHETSPLDRILSRIAFSVAHAFIVQSGEDGGNLRRLRRGARMEVHPLPLFDFFKSGSMGMDEARDRIGEGEGRLLLFFGYIRPYKGLSHLIEAMGVLRDRMEVRLLVVGEFYEERGPYLELVERLGLSERVRFVDRYVGNEEVQAFFAASDLVVLPYISATQSGIAQIALSFDRPVIVTRVGGLPEVVSEGRTGFIVPPADPQAVADAVIEFFQGGWGERMMPHFEEEKRRFSWESLVSTIESVTGTGEG